MRIILKQIKTNQSITEQMKNYEPPEDGSALVYSKIFKMSRKNPVV
ncbi:hypothetical protein Hdeb2414_s0002g00070651 [Helianthus debilis subsp. tardiflorus]